MDEGGKKETIRGGMLCFKNGNKSEGIRGRGRVRAEYVLKDERKKKEHQ